MAGDGAIWRATSSGSEGSNGSDIIEFNNGAAPDNTSNITQTELEMDVGVGENEKAGGDINELQDTGLATITFIITGTIVSPSTTQAVERIKIWLIEQKTNSNFPKGRTGLRLNDFPGFNLTPTASRGYILSNFKFIRPREFRGKLDFIATLRFNGDVGNTPYSW